MRNEKGVEMLTPKTVAEALDLKARFGVNARFVAGGTDLLLKTRAGVYSPQALIRVPGESGPDVEQVDGMLRVCALVPVSQLLSSGLLHDKAPLLAAGLAQLGSPQIRNAATLGGNLGNASPCCDSGPPLLVYEALVEVHSVTSRRMVPADGFFLGPGETVLESDEMVVAVHVPLTLDGDRVFYHKFGARGANVIASANFAGRVGVKDSTLVFVRLAAGSVAPVPARLRVVEDALLGTPVSRLANPEFRAGVADALEQDISPISDVRGSMWYKNKVIQLSVEQMMDELA